MLAVLGEAGPGESGGQQALKAERERGESFERNERLCLVPDCMRGKKDSEESERSPVFREWDRAAPSTETGEPGSGLVGVVGVELSLDERGHPVEKAGREQRRR